MLTPKAAWVLAAVAGLATLGVTLNLFGAAVVGSALLLLFAANALTAAPPQLDASTSLSTDQAGEGQLVRAHVSVTNRGRRSAFFEHRLELPETFRAQLDADGRSPGAGRVVVRGGDEAGWDVVFRPELFGAPVVGPLRVRVSDASGFRYAESTAAPARRLLVLPRIEPLRTAPLRISKQVSFFGVNEAPQPGDGFEFFTLRKYQHGDSQRSINWRASARSEGLIVNQRQRESYLTVAVLLDARAASADGLVTTSPFAQTGRAVASVMDFLLHRRDQVHFYLLTDELQKVQPASPDRQRRAVLEAIATTVPSGDIAWRQAVRQVLPQLRQQTPVVLASPFETDPTIVAAARDLAAREHPLLALSAATQWPDARAGAGGDTGRPDERVVEVRRLHREMVRDELRAAGATWVELRPGTPLDTAFLEAVL